MTDDCTVRISAVNQKFARAQPWRIQIAHMLLESALGDAGMGFPWNEYAVHVAPTHHRSGYCQSQPQPRSNASIYQVRRSRHKKASTRSTGEAQSELFHGCLLRANL